MPAKSFAAGIFPLLVLLVLSSGGEDAHAQFPPTFAPTTNYYPPQASYPVVQAQLSAFDPYQSSGESSLRPVVNFGGVSGSQFWARAEVLLWWTDDYNIPPLVTSNPAGTPLSQTIGVLGQPGTQVLVGNSLDVGFSLGGRFAAGYYFGPNRDTGIQGSFLGLTDNETVQFSHPTILARPFILVDPQPPTAGENAELVSHPDAADGTIQVSTELDLYMGDITVSRRIHEDCGEWLSLLVGYRYAQLDECLQVCDSRVVTSTVFPGIPVDTVFGECDKFQTENRFQGVDLGVSWEACSGPLSLDLLFKMALGNMRTKVAISGFTTATEPGQAPVVTQGGLLALPTNIGTYSSNDFALIPELGARLSYRLRRFEVSTGYTFIYFSQVARPGDQIDRNLNLTQLGGQPLVGAPLPEFQLVKTDFWAQGINFGATMRF